MGRVSLFDINPLIFVGKLMKIIFKFASRNQIYCNYFQFNFFLGLANIINSNKS